MTDAPTPDTPTTDPTTPTTSPSEVAVETPPAPLTEEQVRGVEALLFLAADPLDPASIAEVVEADPGAVETCLQELSARYLDEHRGMEIRWVAGGWRMYSAAATKPYIERWALAGRTGRLTQAALETLAVIAYKQPIGRQEIGDIRGVNADGAVRSLIARGLVAEVGRDPGPGQAALFGTTRTLLERLGLSSLEELPELTDFLPEAPAPDEPELNAFKEIRRRLAAGGELASAGLGGRSATQTNTGTGEDADDADEELLPGPARAIGERHGDDQMDELTDRLESAARNAVGRLRAAVAASETDGDDDADGIDTDAGGSGAAAHGTDDEAEDDRG